jgi:two-component system, OmpR family, response regulator
MPKPQPTIFLCEDDIDLALATTELLEEEGFRVIVTHDADELREALVVDSPDIFVLDIQLPGESGLRVANTLQESWSRVPIVMLSAFDQLKNRLASYSNGAMFFMAKPYEPEELIAVIRSLLRLEERVLGEPSLSSLSISRSILTGPSGRVRLTERESRILRAFAGRVDAKAEYFELLEAIALELNQPNKQRLEVICSRLRPKLRRAAGIDAQLNNKKGYGYQLVMPLTIID